MALPSLLVLIRKWCMVFEAIPTEAAFLDERSTSMLRLLRVLAVSTLIFGMQFVVQSSEVDSTLALVVAVAAESMLVLIAIHLPPLRVRLTSSLLEKVFALHMLLVFAAATLTAKRRYARWVQAMWTNEECAAEGINLTTILPAIIVVTVVLVSSMRFLIAFPMSALKTVSMSIYCLCYMPGPVSPRATSAISIVLMFVLLSVNKYFTERQERRAFSLLLKEKQKRAGAEFKLSTIVENNDVVESHGPTPKPFVAHDARSAARSEPSLPSTRATERIFALDSDMQLQFEQLMQIGKQEQWLVELGVVQVCTGGMLGHGGFGVVLKGTFEGSPAAVKCAIRDPDEARSTEDLRQICNELRLLRRLRHPNIVRFLGAHLDRERGSVAIILELLSGETLASNIAKQPQSVPRMQLMFDVAFAVRYLHTRMPVIVHGDLKDSNIFVVRAPDRIKSGCQAKLLDFGLSAALTKTARVRGGTVRWQAPEVVHGQAPITSSDVYAVGAVCFMVASGLRPHGAASDTRVRMAMKSGNPLPLMWPHERYPLVMAYRDVVAECCQQNPRVRPSMHAVPGMVMAAARDVVGPDFTFDFDPAEARPLEEALAEARIEVAEKKKRATRIAQWQQGQLSHLRVGEASMDGEAESDMEVGAATASCSRCSLSSVLTTCDAPRPASDAVASWPCTPSSSPRLHHTEEKVSYL